MSNTRREPRPLVPGDDAADACSQRHRLYNPRATNVARTLVFRYAADTGSATSAAVKYAQSG
jgi:hypothetical protein